MPIDPYFTKDVPGKYGVMWRGKSLTEAAQALRHDPIVERRNRPVKRKKQIRSMAGK